VAARACAERFRGAVNCGMARILFMGTAPFAVPSIAALAAAGHELIGAVCQPDRPHGRGSQVRPGAVKAAASELGVPVMQPEKASDPAFISQVRDAAPDVIAVVAYGQILRPALLDIPPLGSINVHASVLPALRGAAPIQWAIIRGFAETGVTTMRMDPGMDTGDIILQRSTPISSGDTAGSLGARLAVMGADLLVETVTLLLEGKAPGTPQDQSRASYAPMLRKEDGLLDWRAGARDIRNRIHGCNPAPGAHTYRGERMLKIWRAEVLENALSPGSSGPGTVLVAPGDELVLSTGEGMIRLLEVQPESRSRMSGDEFQRGYRVMPGECWRSALPDGAAA
jgi:methionyl-tRNA formyltransferase